jgi:hypothetical protein
MVFVCREVDVKRKWEKKEIIRKVVVEVLNEHGVLVQEGKLALDGNV